MAADSRQEFSDVTIFLASDAIPWASYLERQFQTQANDDGKTLSVKTVFLKENSTEGIFLYLSICFNRLHNIYCFFINRHVFRLN